MIPHNSLTRNTAAYIVNLIISVEQYFLQRAYFNNRSALQRDHAMVRTWYKTLQWGLP